MIRAGLLFALLAANPAAARDILLAHPLACVLGESCFIQNYVDADQGPGGADFTCGPLSYDGHKGSDFALPSLAEMKAGVAVLAAAPGRVQATRDGEVDNGLPREGRECGNGVVIDHGGGWESQYCHMKAGSVAVTPGQRVVMGAKLGQVGLSGNTQFPHLHFELRFEGEIIDPFNRDAITTCGPEPDDQLWKDPVAYRAGGLITTGMAVSVPEYTAIKAGEAAQIKALPDAPALVVWAYVFGAREGDILRLSITDETDAVVVANDITLERTQAQLFRAMGKRTPATGWPPGVYLGESRLIRNGNAIDTSSARITMQQAD